MPAAPHLVLVGAGHAHALVLRDLARRPVAGLAVTLLTRHALTPYSGMLPGLVAGHYRHADAHIDTRPLTRRLGAALIEDEAVGLDVAGRRVLRRNGSGLPYDICAIDIGSTPNTDAVPGAADHAVPVKPIDGFLQQFAVVTQRITARRGRARVAVVGAGAGGLELLLAVQHRLRREVAAAGGEPAALGFVLISAAGLLPGFPDGFRRRLHRILVECGVELVTDAPAEAVEPGRVFVAGRAPVAADEVLWVTQAAPARWLADTGLPLDPRGFLKVEATLQVPGHPGLFAAGDVAAFGPRDLPKAGVYAVRAAPVLADNIRRTLAGQPLRPFVPQREALYLLSAGGRYAVGTRNGLAFEGRWVWRWKNWLDRRFMAQFPAGTPGGADG